MTEDRKTIICVFIDEKKKEFCVRNRNSDSFDKKFREDFNIVYSEELAIVENVVRMQKLYDSENFHIAYIISAKNIRNTDQKEINRIKEYEISKYQSNGYTWNDSLDEFIIPAYNDNEENRRIKESIINYRNLSTLYDEMLRKKLNEFERKSEEIKENFDAFEKEYKQKKIKLDDEYNKVYVEHATLSSEIDLLHQNISILNNDIESKKNTKWALENEINTLDKLIANKTEANKEIVEEYERNKEKLQSEISKLNEHITALKEEASVLETRNKEITDDINKRISSYVNDDELMSKLNRLISMIIINENFYHSQVPDYEINHLIKLGVDKNIIREKLIKNKLTIRNT